MNVSKEIFKERMHICYDCEQYRALTKQCKKCNCFLFVKAFLQSTTCPLGKWNERKNNQTQD